MRKIQDGRQRVDFSPRENSVSTHHFALKIPKNCASHRTYLTNTIQDRHLIGEGGANLNSVFGDHFKVVSDFSQKIIPIRSS